MALIKTWFEEFFFSTYKGWDPLDLQKWFLQCRGVILHEKNFCKTRSSSNMSKNAHYSASGWNPKLHNYHTPLPVGIWLWKKIKKIYLLKSYGLINFLSLSLSLPHSSNHWHWYDFYTSLFSKHAIFSLILKLLQLPQFLSWNQVFFVKIKFYTTRQNVPMWGNRLHSGRCLYWTYQIQIQYRPPHLWWR